MHARPFIGMYMYVYVCTPKECLFVCTSVFFDAKYVCVCRSASIYVCLYICISMCMSVCLYVLQACMFDPVEHTGPVDS